MGHYERISVGDKIKELATNEIMIRMSFDSSIGWKLVVGFPEIRKEENDAFIYGDLLAAFTVVMDTPFFLFSFGGGPWMDTPFEPRIDASLPSFDIQLDDGDGLGLLIMSVDTKYGEVKGFRQSTFMLSPCPGGAWTRTQHEGALRYAGASAASAHNTGGTQEKHRAGLSYIRAAGRYASHGETR